MNPITIPNISIPTIGIPTIGIPSVGFPSASGGGGLSWPAGMKEHIKAWYDPKKQGLTNYDVIEAYTEDFKKWNNSPEKYTGSLTSNSLALTNVSQKTALIYSPIKPYDFKVLIRGLQEGQHVKFGFDYGETILEADKDGVYTLEWKEGLISYGIYTNFVGECNITITQLPTSILKDFSGNKHDAYLYGFKGKLNSGVGIYKVDFTAYTKTNIVSDVSYNAVKIIPTQINYSFVIYGNKEIPSYTVNVQNPTNSIITYQYATENRREEIILTNGINKLPKSINSNQGYQIGFKINSIDDTNSEEITITQIPDYPNQLCYDGKSYAVAYDMPILTDYTVMADRTWFEKGTKGVFMSKAVPNNDSAFIFEHIQSNTQGTWNYGLQNVMPIKDNGVVYQTKFSYNGDKINVGGAKDSDTLHIGKTRESSSAYFIGCHGAIIVADRSFTEEEINWLKQNWDKI